ncbi:MAG: hypothetical protein IJ748_02730 [Bacteroidales bacterium]|nr:hypothetical protein [Bacteroidales bacterium]
MRSATGSGVPLALPTTTGSSSLRHLVVWRDCMFIYLDERTSFLIFAVLDC